MTTTARVFVLLLSAVATSQIAEGKALQAYVNPVGLFVGLQDLGIDIAVSDNLTLGPKLSRIDQLKSGTFSETNLSGTGVGLRVSYQFGGEAISTGWLMSASTVYTARYTLSRTILASLPFTAETSYTHSTAAVGYQWVWSVVSLRLAGGAYYNSLPKTIPLENITGTSMYEIDNAGLGGGGELALGIVF